MVNMTAFATLDIIAFVVRPTISQLRYEVARMLKAMMRKLQAKNSAMEKACFAMYSCAST